MGLKYITQKIFLKVNRISIIPVTVVRLKAFHFFVLLHLLLSISCTGVFKKKQSTIFFYRVVLNKVIIFLNWFWFYSIARYTYFDHKNLDRAQWVLLKITSSCRTKLNDNCYMLFVVIEKIYTFASFYESTYFGISRQAYGFLANQIDL